MVQTAIQLFTLKNLDEPPWNLAELVGETAFDGVEFYDRQFDAFTLAGIVQTTDALDEGNLGIAGAHIRIERLESSFDEVVGICEHLGCNRLVVPTYEREAFESCEGIEAAADRIAGVATELDAYDIELSYHNHTFEFDEVDGEIAFETFVDHADGRFKFQPDVGLATNAGYDPLQLLELVEGNAPVVHLTDTDPSEENRIHADLGTGVVDIDACAAAAADGGAEWLVCEVGRPDDATASLEHGASAFANLRDELASQS
ncbi:sugar phosphate isomerase/epimerase family protein [Haloprofundus salinisoli]|uniref:sugar phosphate isomerase/epimerase family protein n=1 Tax=Haloprofundus salinisoli TaxID=2876193 RepID=UPI001CC9F18B|nr:TIM barrel protein [Haloprofundus salinisoli]